MDSEFWLKSWSDGKIAFHRPAYNDKLLEYFPRLDPRKGQKVLVPLCGKSKDLLWLHELGLKVDGFELSPLAVEAFFSENELSPVEKIKDRDFTHFSWENITISCGDFFKLDVKAGYDLVYDRAALVALPETMRGDYARLIRDTLKKGGKYLLISYEYDPSTMEGPPFSVDAQEIHRLYGQHFQIRRMESETPIGDGAKLASAVGLKQSVYILERS